MKEFGVETFEAKKKKQQRNVQALIDDDAASDISKAISQGKTDAAIEKEFTSKYMTAKAVLGRKDQEIGVTSSPNELGNEVQTIGEDYRGLHQ